MNRPSRTDDDFEHPTWNQNPPFLAPDLTTCQDLNGIANAREQRNQGSGATNAFGFPNDEKATDPRGFGVNAPRLPLAACAMSGRKLHLLDWMALDTVLTLCNLIGPLIAASATALGGEGRACRSRRSIRPPSGWIGWIASVVVMSTVFHVVGNAVPALFSGRVVSNNFAVLEPTVVKGKTQRQRNSFLLLTPTPPPPPRYPLWNMSQFIGYSIY